MFLLLVFSTIDEAVRSWTAAPGRAHQTPIYLFSHSKTFSNDFCRFPTLRQN